MRTPKPPNPYKPGEAYRLAMEAIAMGDFTTAKELQQYMVESDAGLVEKRMAPKANVTL